MRHDPDPHHFPAGAALSAPGYRVNEVVELGGRPLFPACLPGFLPLVHFSVGIPTPAGFQGFPGGSMVKNLPAVAGATGDMGLIPGLGRFPGGGNGNPLQYSCPKNPMIRGTWWATVQGIARSGT